MTTKVFSISEALYFGWATTKSNLGFFIKLLIIVGPLLFIPHIIAREALEINTFLGIILHIADYALATLISIGLVKISLIFYDYNKGQLKDLFSQYRLFFKYLLTLVIYTLIVLGGLLLLIIPGIIWAIKFQFFSYLIIDKKLEPIEALKQSSAITRGIKWRLLAFFLVMGLINILGALLLLVGLFITVPITMLATAFVYRKLLAQTEIVTASQATPQVAFQTTPETTA